MKNFTSLLTRGGALLILTVSFTTNAQHLPNVGFNNWKGSCGSSLELGRTKTGGSIFSPVYGISSKESQRPGDEPAEWNGSSVNQLSMTQTLVTKESETIDEQENVYVNLTSKFIGLLGIGSNAPGYLTLGTPWVYAQSSDAVATADGGTYGGAENAGYKPYGLKFRAKRTDTNDEVSIIKAYLWTGASISKIGNKALSISMDQTDCDRAILGGELANSADQISGDCKVIARLDSALTNEVNEWTEFTIRFKYFDNDGVEIPYVEGTNYLDNVVYGVNATAPTKHNVIICSGNYTDRNALIAGTTLLIDDVDFVYPSVTYVGTAANTDQNTANADLEWSDATLVIEDYGNNTCKVTLGDIVLDGVKFTNNDGLISLEYADTLEDGSNVTLNGNLNGNGTYNVHYTVTSADASTYTGIIFADATTAETTGIESVNGEAIKAIVLGGQGYVSVVGVEGTVAIYSMTGAKLSETYVNGDAVIPAPAGVVIVALPGSAVKTTVK